MIIAAPLAMSDDDRVELKRMARSMSLSHRTVREIAVVFSFDEKTQCQALDRTQPSLSLRPGRAGTQRPTTANATAPQICSRP